MSYFDKIFSNFFKNKAITNTRIIEFADDLIDRLTVHNTDGINTVHINRLTPALSELKAGLGGTDTALGIQKGKTMTVDQFLEDFREFLRFSEGAITYALGGTKTPAYLEFFPAGIGEYTKATKGQMHMLLNRLKTAATKYTGKLDAAVAGRLMEFESAWQAVRSEQRQQKASLDGNRNEREGAREELEIVMGKIIYAIADRHTYNEEECLKYFDFNLLFGQTRKKKDEEVANS